MTPEEQLLRIAALQRRFINFDTDIKRLWKRASFSPQGYVGTPAAAEAPVVPAVPSCEECVGDISSIVVRVDHACVGRTDTDFEFWNGGVLTAPFTFSGSSKGGSFCTFDTGYRDLGDFSGTTRWGFYRVYCQLRFGMSGSDRVITSVEVTGTCCGANSGGWTWDSTYAPGTLCSALSSGPVSVNLLGGEISFEDCPGSATATVELP